MVMVLQMISVLRGCSSRDVKGCSLSVVKAEMVMVMVAMVEVRDSIGELKARKNRLRKVKWPFFMCLALR